MRCDRGLTCSRSIGLDGVDRVKNLFVLVRAGDGQHFGVRASDVFGLGT